MCMRGVSTAALAVALVAAAVSLRADVISIAMVPVGNPGNAADTTGYGAVSYNYNIGEYDVTTGQYAAFLNSVATQSDPFGLYSPGMALDLPTVHITQTPVVGVPGISYSYSVTGTAPGATNMPVFDVSWGDAARFCNWLQNGQPTSGTEAAGTTETGTYALNGGTSTSVLMAVTRNPNATYFIPSENEWYKAAYYDPTLNGGAGGYWAYPTKSNTAPNNSLALASTSTNDANYLYADPTNHLTPVGTFAASPSAYGAYDMGGDVFQWNEANISDSYRGLRGGSWNEASIFLASSTDSSRVDPTYEGYYIGFRVASVASVPEPGTLAMLLAGAVVFGIWRQRRNA